MSTVLQRDLELVAICLAYDIDSDDLDELCERLGIDQRNAPIDVIKGAVDSKYLPMPYITIGRKPSVPKEIWEHMNLAQELLIAESQPENAIWLNHMRDMLANYVIDVGLLISELRRLRKPC